MSKIKGLFECCINQLSISRKEIETLNLYIGELEYQDSSEGLSPLCHSSPSHTALLENNIRQQEPETLSADEDENCKFRLQVLESRQHGISHYLDL